MHATGRYPELNGNQIKLIACAIMLIDHITAGILFHVINAGMYPDSISFETMKTIYDTLRLIGRSAFPLFAFLLVEGFVYTKNRLRYSLRLLFFGIISEPFYDVAFYPKKEIFNINILEVLKANASTFSNNSNVFFSLFIGVVSLWAFESILTFAKESKAPQILSYLLAAFPPLLGMIMAKAVECDYRGYGIALMVIFYLFRNYRPYNLAFGYILFCFYKEDEYYSLPAFLLLLLYNKKQGRKLGKLKYAFYLFYPVHILLIYLARCLIFGQ